MKSGRTTAALAAILLLGCSPGPGDEPRAGSAPDSSATISLSSGVIDTRGPSPDVPDALRLRGEAGDAAGERYVLVKYPGPITAAQDGALRAAAARVYTYLPSFAYLVRMDDGNGGSKSAEALAAAGAVWSGPYHPYYKISRAVRETPGHAPGAVKSVMIQVYPDADINSVVEAVRGLGISTIAGSKEGSLFSRVRVLMTHEEIARYRERLARMPEVFWIDIEPRRALLNDTTIWVGQSGLSGGKTTPVFDNGLYGHDQIVGVLDTGIDPDMCYFRDPALGPPPINACNGGTAVNHAQRKVVAVNFLAASECAGGISASEWDTQDHGTHVAGTVAGDNFASLVLHDDGDGMAPGAKLVIQDGGYQVDFCGDLPGIGCPVVDLKPIFQQAYDQGARIHTNSWGDQEANPIQNTYTVACEDADQFMWEHKDMLLVFAAGNTGPAAGTVGSPSTAKSGLSVGATQRASSAGGMAGFSSCGPTSDGRIKPEVTIPGQQIVSADNDGNAGSNNCETRLMSGTSMASPAAAGLAALVRQYYQNGFQSSGAASAIDAFDPSGAMLRATLVGSAVGMQVGAIPANCQGWGRITLDEALYFPGDARRLWVSDDAAGFSTGSSGEAKSYTFTVHASGAPFKVTLAWSDFPSTAAASKHLINDLDLEVTGPGGAFLGNVFTAGESAPGGSEDRVDTLEQVLLKNPAAGEYTVSVRSFNVPNGPQPFALVVMGASRTGTPGAACGAAADCASGFCVDGVCCSSACDAGACDACSSAAGASVDGDCELLTGTACDDGDACTQVDMCNAGACAGTIPVVCAAVDQCHEAGACDPATGACDNPSKADGTACDDGSACTKVDACQAGACAGADPVVCAAVDQCHEAGVCDPATGLCDAPAKADGAQCDDGDACTAEDVCEMGACKAGAAVGCPAPDACKTGGLCDSATGACVFSDAPDGTACPGGECAGGACVPLEGASSSSASASSSGGGGGGLDIGESGGCGCRAAGSPSSGGAAGALAVMLFMLRKRRHRRGAIK